MNSTAEIRRPRDDERDLFGLTHVGKVRQENQDHFLICTVYRQVVIDVTSLPNVDQLELRGPRLATIGLVADGVGGSDGGSDASRLAAETITRYVASTLRSYHAAGSANEDVLMKSLTDAVLQAHDVVRAESATRADPRPMATTLTLCMGVWPWMYVVQVGDSRCYYFDGNRLSQVTRDQTIAQHLVDTGALPKERLASSPFKHVLASAIGGEEALPQVSRIDLRRSGTTFMCSDGLTRHVSDEEIEAHIKAMTSSKQLCETLLALALERGGLDNITILAARAPLPKA
ncbi:MAG: protein phosphatase 2C domain-containing protein [Gemmatimonadota bacterium]